MKPLSITALVVTLVVASSASAQLDHAAEPLLVVPSEPLPGTQDSEQLVHDFASAYARAGKPTIVIYWNRDFGELVTDWETNYRAVSANRFSYAASNSSASGDTAHGAYNDATAKAHQPRQDPRVSLINRGGSNQGRSQQEQQTFVQTKFNPSTYKPENYGSYGAFGSGFVTTLLLAKTQLIDRSTIIRLADAAETSATVEGSIPDYRKIEKAALLQHADYVLEIFRTRGGDFFTEQTFRVTVKQLLNGRIVAMLSKSGAELFSERLEQYRWVAAADGGFVKQYSYLIPSPFEIGERLAMETMRELTNTW